MIVNDSYTASISRFMRWAEETIESEIEFIERCEKEFGDAEVHKQSKETKPKNLTTEQKRELVEQVDNLYELHPNLSRVSACEEIGIHNTTYYKWKGELS